MTAPHIVDPSGLLGEALAEASPDLMRNLLQDVYFGKTRDIVNEIRSETALSEVKRQDTVRKELIGKLQEREKK